MRARLARLRRGDASRGSPLERRLRRISALERRAEARAFLDHFHDETGAGRAQRQRRWAEVRQALRRRGHYEHTSEELAFGARLAWRNTGRCIGRLAWESLDVADCRHLTSPDAIAARMGHHLAEADPDRGRLRSVISIFAPVRGTVLPAWIESSQIIRYAGYARDALPPVGDRQNVEATRLALSMGWTPPGVPGPFDLLPYFIRDNEDRRVMVSPPAERIRQVRIVHPEHAALGALELRWYAVPVVSDMILTIGGLDYPCAPFNGYYMSTEIASRNLVDATRYDLLPQVAEAVGLDTSSGAPMWRDVALTELNRAVLHSFRAAGVTMIDHHAASEQFMQFHHREQASGRRVAADWRWIVPPQASAATDVFHLKMRNFHPVPNFYRDRGSDGLRLMPWHGDGYRGRVSAGIDRIARRARLWKRMAW